MWTVVAGRLLQILDAGDLAEFDSAFRTVAQALGVCEPIGRQAASAALSHIGGPLEAWISSLGSLRSVLADLARELDGLDLEAIVFPHCLSGPLDGRQRLEFLRFHMERHIEQIRRIQSHAAYPK